MQQQTSEWFESRLGKATASRISDIVGKLQSGKYTQKRQDYFNELVAERLTGQVTRRFVSVAMQHGIDTEAEARAFYEAQTGLVIEECGFVEHPTIPMSGASPDGLIEKDGLIEIKCPTTTTHIDFFLTKAIPEQYRLQMLWQLACTQRAWCDLVSYDPRLPDRYKMVVVRMQYDRSAAEALEVEVIRFLADIDQFMDRIATTV